VNPWIIAISKGYATGLILGLLSFGPSFFTLIHAGIQGGKRAGLRMAMGIFMSETLVALACFFGLSSYFVLPAFKLVFSGIASVGLLIMGFRAWYSNNKDLPQLPASASASFSKGFITNSLNPFVLMLWVGILATASVGNEGKTFADRLPILVQLFGILFALFSLDLGKVYLSDYIGKKISNRVFSLITRYFGFILIAIGLYFGYQFIDMLWLRNSTGY
jgi:threonine/homoserine/homoserine lactone efflux protein